MNASEVEHTTGLEILKTMVNGGELVCANDDCNNPAEWLSIGLPCRHDGPICQPCYEVASYAVQRIEDDNMWRALELVCKICGVPMTGIEFRPI